MYPLVYKYLMLNKKVSVPGIGNFSIDTKPAFIEHGNLLQPPVSNIQFKAETALADRNFYEFIASEMHIEDVDAIKQFHEFSYELRGSASYADGLQFPGIGTLKKQSNGSFLFEEEQNTVDFYKPFTIKETVEAEKIVAAEIPTIEPDYSNLELTPTDEADQPRDLWWVYAIALAVIGIAAIVYNYM